MDPFFRKDAWRKANRRFFSSDDDWVNRPEDSESGGIPLRGISLVGNRRPSFMLATRLRDEPMLARRFREDPVRREEEIVLDCKALRRLVCGVSMATCILKDRI